MCLVTIDRVGHGGADMMSLNVPESSPTDELARLVFPLSVNDGGSTDSF